MSSTTTTTNTTTTRVLLLLLLEYPYYAYSTTRVLVPYARTRSNYHNNIIRELLPVYIIMHS